jgi:type IV pilus assembly protein PilC
MKKIITKKISTGELIRLTMQLEVLLANRVPLIRSLELIIAGLDDNYSLRDKLKAIRNSIEKGISLTAAFRRFGNYFPDLFLSVLEVGETAGDIPVVLSGIRQYYIEVQKIKESLVKALIYPVFTILTAIIVISVMLFAILPSFADIYRSFGTPVPVYTEMLLRLSAFIQENIFLISVITIVIAVIVVAFHAKFGHFLLHIAFRISPLRPLIRLVYQARFTAALAILLRNHISLPESLKITLRFSSFSSYQRDLRYLLAITDRGELFTRLKSSELLFTPYLTEIFRSGEESADLGRTFTRLAEYYRRETEYKTDKILAVMEPALIILIGIVVGFILIALYIPLFEISSGIGG